MFWFFRGNNLKGISRPNLDMLLNLLHRFGDIPLPTQRPRHGRRPTALRRPTDRHCWPRLTDRRPTPADWPTGWQVESQAPAEGFLGPSVGPTHRKKKSKKASGVYTQKLFIHQKTGPVLVYTPRKWLYTKNKHSPDNQLFAFYEVFLFVKPMLVYTPQNWLYTKTKDPRFGVYTPKMLIHQKPGFYIHQKHIYTRKTQNKICGMLGCSEVGEGQGHGCWVSLWSVGLVGSCRQSPMEYLVEPVCLAHCIVLCFVLGHLMCCLFSGPWYISVFSRIGQIPRRDSQGFSLFPTQGLCFRVLYNSLQTLASQTGGSCKQVVADAKG